MGDMFVSLFLKEKLTLGLKYQAVKAFLSAEPCVASLAWWYIGSCLSAVCLCQRMRDIAECSLLTSVIISVSLREPVAGKTQQALHFQHVMQKKRQNL